MEATYQRFQLRQTAAAALTFAYCTKWALWSLFPGPFPSTATIVGPVLLALAVGYVRVSGGKVEKRKYAWMAAGAAAGALALFVIALK